MKANRAGGGGKAVGDEKCGLTALHDAAAAQSLPSLLTTFCVP